MGIFISRILDSLSGTKQKRILLLGLDAAGKTTILYKLNLGETVTTIPTVGFNVETVKYRNIDFNCWDIGGQKKIRALWNYYYEGTDAVIFVLDSNDPDRVDEAREELFAIMDHELLRGASLLIYANKQDLQRSMNTAELVERLQLQTKFRGISWHVQGTVAVSGQGLYEGLDWLSKVLSSSNINSANNNSSINNRVTY